MFSKLETYFHMAAQGNEEAQTLLYKEFVKKAKLVVSEAIKMSSAKYSYDEDFHECIDMLYLKAINEYDQKRGSFSVYCDYLFNHRLLSMVKEQIVEQQSHLADISYDEEDVNAIELLADPYQKDMVSDIAINSFITQIASPNKHKSNNKRLLDKILMLHYGGCSKAEICQILHMSKTTLKKLEAEIQKDIDIVNLKLDLK